MPEVKFVGLSKKDANKVGTFSHAISRLIKRGGNLETVMEDIGRTGVTMTLQKLLGDQVTPKTTKETLDLRKKYRKKRKKRVTSINGIPVGDGVTLVDTGIGARQVTFMHNSRMVAVGVPPGYMAYHHQGRVPNAPRRRFLVLPGSKYIVSLVNQHWHKVVKG